MAGSIALNARSICPRLAFTAPLPVARRVERDPRHDLVGDFLRQPFERGLLGGDGGIFGADHVDAGVGAGGRVEQDGADVAASTSR